MTSLADTCRLSLEDEAINGVVLGTGL